MKYTDMLPYAAKTSVVIKKNCKVGYYEESSKIDFTMQKRLPY